MQYNKFYHRLLINYAWKLLHYRSQRVFCIGFNKTGTTSLATALRDLGYRIGNQQRAELLLGAYIAQDFRPIIEYCRTALAFQDIPFSLPFTYQVLDRRFQNSKFILSIRDDEDQWFQSLIRFHSKKFGNGKVPDRQDLERASYRQPGWILRAHCQLFGLTPTDDLYDERVLKERYLEHNQNVIEYFNLRDDLAVINVAETDSYRKLCSFLGKSPKYCEFPWENKGG